MLFRSLLGLVTLNEIGWSGAVLQMFSHGIIAGLLFGVVGRMVYDRAHTRELDKLEGMGLLKAIPFAAVTFVIAGFASMGMPGFSGFVAEFQVLIGAWQAFPKLAVLAGVGIVVGVVYTLKTTAKVFFPDKAGAEVPDHGDHELEPISVQERLGAALLIFCTVLIGLQPRLLLDLIVPSFQSPLFAGLRKAVGL